MSWMGDRKEGGRLIRDEKRREEKSKVEQGNDKYA